MASFKAQLFSLALESQLDVSKIEPSNPGTWLRGHLLQIFIRREFVDHFAYAALPYGILDNTRMPISETLLGKGPIRGQVRICFHPSIFMNSEKARLYLYSSDPTFHQKRPEFQEKLIALLKPHLEKLSPSDSPFMCKCKGEQKT